jgi:hypothetical protein
MRELIFEVIQEADGGYCAEMSHPDNRDRR